LLEQLSLTKIQGENILIVCGQGGRRLLEEALEKRGAHCSRLEVYCRCYPQKNEQGLQVLLANAALDFILVTSGQALINLVQMAGNLEKVLKAQQLIVISQRIADKAQALGFNKPAIIEALTSASILKVINDGEK